MLHRLCARLCVDTFDTQEPSSLLQWKSCCLVSQVRKWRLPGVKLLVQASVSKQQSERVGQGQAGATQGGGARQGYELRAAFCSCVTLGKSSQRCNPSSEAGRLNERVEVDHMARCLLRCEMLNNPNYCDHFLGKGERGGPAYSHQTSSRPCCGHQDNGHHGGRKAIPEEARRPGYFPALRGVEPTLGTSFSKEWEYGERVGEKRAPTTMGPFSVPVASQGSYAPVHR